MYLIGGEGGSLRRGGSQETQGVPGSERGGGGSYYPPIYLFSNPWRDSDPEDDYDYDYDYDRE